MALDAEKLTAEGDVFMRLAHERHSCRAFLDQPLEREKIEQLLAVAQRAPSDCNTQAWKTFVVSGAPLEALRQRLYDQVTSRGENSYDLAPIGQYEGDLLERRRECGWALYGAVGIQKGDREASRAQALKNFQLFGAPHLAIVTCDASLGERGVFDAGIYMGYLILAAEALGIGAVPQAAVTHHADILREAAGIPAHLRVACVMSFGLEDKADASNRFHTSRAAAEDYSSFIE